MHTYSNLKSRQFVTFGMLNNILDFKSLERVQRERGKRENEQRIEGQMEALPHGSGSLTSFSSGVKSYKYDQVFWTGWLGPAAAPRAKCSRPVEVVH